MSVMGQKRTLSAAPFDGRFAPASRDQEGAASAAGRHQAAAIAGLDLNSECAMLCEKVIAKMRG